MIAAKAEQATDLPLNVAVRGDEVLILSPQGLDVRLSLRAAQRSAQRLLDAIAVAQGRPPSSAN